MEPLEPRQTLRRVDPPDEDQPNVPEINLDKWARYARPADEQLIFNKVRHATGQPAELPPATPGRLIPESVTRPRPEHARRKRFTWILPKWISPDPNPAN